MSTRNREKQALQNSTNSFVAASKPTNGKAGACHINKKLSEEEWRGHVLSYYQIKKKSISKFLKERGLVQRSIFEKRWKQSGLRELKKKDAPYLDAIAQYDFWLQKWKERLAETKRTNGRKAFKIFVDPDDLEDVETNTNEKDEGLFPDEASVNCKNNGNGGGKDLEEENTDDDGGGNGEDLASTEILTKEQRNMKQQLPHDKMKALLTEIYIKNGKVSVVLREKDLFRNKNAVYRHWNESGLKQMKENGELVGKAMVKYNQWYLKQKGIHDDRRRKNGSIEKALPAKLEEFMSELIKQLALCGQGIGKKVASRVFEEALNGWGVQSFSSKTLDRYVAKYDLECRVLKNIDPARIAQVTEVNRDAFFFRLDQVVALLHDVDPHHCPWKDWRSVDSKFIDNVDEMGSDTTQHRDVLLIPKTVTQRLFQSTPEGDRANRHVTVVVFSKSNGWYKDDDNRIDGAPPPMIIHSKPSPKEKGTTSLEKRLQLYSANADDDILVDQSYLEGLSEGNPLGITVRTSTNGSMNKELFLDLACHYTRHLGPDQGPGGMYTFLLTDSHVSRWHPQALYLLMKNRVIPLFFPSHLSIVAQPQDNGVILFLHKCIEDTVTTERLFRSSTDVAYINKVLELAFILFRDTERKKLMDRGSNSTTRSYRATGMKPCDPFSTGWRENLELYASFNGLRMDAHSDRARNYGVRPKNRSICPVFSEAEIALLDEAVPLLAKNGVDDITILDDPKTKCYAVANEIISNWVEKPYDERAIRPRATTPVEKLALKHMDITHVVSLKPVTDEALSLVDLQHRENKRQAILGQTKTNECIQVRPKDSDESSMWITAIKMRSPENMWHIFDGITSQSVSTLDLDKGWDINLAFDMFPTDKRLQDARNRAGRRRRDEKDRMLNVIATSIAEEERCGDLEEAFNRFMRQSKGKQTFTTFKETLVTKIEEPSEHIVTVNLGSEEHTIKVCAHGNNKSSMSRLVMDNICKTLACIATRSERKKNNSGRRRGGKVVSVKRGSDGFQKILQIDEQHQKDLLQQIEDNDRVKKAKLLLCQRRLKELRGICLLREYQRIWNHDELLISNSKHLSKQNLISFLKVYNIEGRTKLSKEPRSLIEAKLDENKITQSSIEKTEVSLLEELRVLGGEDNFQVDQSFDSSVDFDSDGSTSFGEDYHLILESETSCDQNGNAEKSNDDGDSTDSEDINGDCSGNVRRKVSFHEQPTIYHIPRRSRSKPAAAKGKNKNAEVAAVEPTTTKKPETRRKSSRRRTPKKIFDR